MVDLRRRRYLFAGIAVLALLLLVVLPGFLASRPAFFGRVPSLSKKYEAWSTSTHVGAGCEGCHVPPNAVAKTTYRARMVGEFYLSLRLPLAGTEGLQHSDQRGVPGLPQ